MFEHEDKLAWHLRELPGVTAVSIHGGDLGTFRVDVEVRSGELDTVWDDLVAEVEAFERSLCGEVGLDLEVHPS